MKKVLTKKGFTLIELIVVIGILAVLAVVLIPSIMNYVGEARTARNNANARALYSEVSAELAMGTLPATPLTRTEGGVKCDWTLTATGQGLATFSCATVNSAKDGKVTITFTP